MSNSVLFFSLLPFFRLTHSLVGRRAGVSRNLLPDG
jgi:hypothetical protein